MKFEFMSKYEKEFNIGQMANILGVSRSGYYNFSKRSESFRAKEHKRLKEKIKKIHEQNRGIYGSPRVHAVLKKQGETCSRRKVAKIMREEKIQAKMRKRWKKTTKVNEKAEVSLNHLNQNFMVEAPDKVWVSDITYIPTQEGWLYVAIVMDLFSRKVVGLSMGNRLQTNLVTNALKQALNHRSIPKGLIHHSDKGCQYTSREFRELANRYGIKLSMSIKGNCYDNAVAESFFHTLKTEHTHFCKYRIREEAKSSIFEYIEVFYNRKRLHSTNGYFSPQEYENIWKSKRYAD
ncbi:putative transposase OrfB [Candidatus Rubidus massiliensis]|nr:putative transposase OrfB [Candidatus Rubidus massiliensis]